MKYTEVTLHITPLDPFKDLLVYALGEEGPYDSFVDIGDGIKAYVPTNQYDEAFLKSAIVETGCEVAYEVRPMEDRNWNEEWEKQHKPVLVEDFCWVRAPFHPHRDDVEFEIEIEPKMSFGTAHHATTYMMLTLLRDESIRGRRVLDMGSGTAVLAILAAKKGASYVEAVDVDEWAYRNAVENCERNDVRHINCVLGDASILAGGAECDVPHSHFDLITANINRNILLHDMSAYVGVLNPGGIILFSGFYEADVPAIRRQAESLGLCYDRQIVRDGWTAVRFIRK